jgi:poly-gamma-glutamate synthesis protein (capsule biosynthesis protein)
MHPMNELVIMLVGDVFYVEDTGEEPIFENILPLFQKADMRFANLEMVLSDRGEPGPLKPAGTPPRRMHPGMIKAFANASIDVVSMANNHIMDFGQQALLHNIEILDDHGIAHTGAGANIDEALKPALLIKKGYRVGFISYTCLYGPGFRATKERPGVATFKVNTAYQPPPRVLEQPGTPPIVVTFPDSKETYQLQNQINTLRPKVDILIVSWHWGTSEGLNDILGYQKELGHICIDAGADLVIGHHPHCIQGIEVYKGKIIAYSLGSFVGFVPRPESMKFFNRNSMVLNCVANEKGLTRAFITPAIADDRWHPRRTSQREFMIASKLITELCIDLGTELKQRRGCLELVLS